MKWTRPVAGRGGPPRCGSVFPPPADLPEPQVLEEREADERREGVVVQPQPGPAGPGGTTRPSGGAAVACCKDAEVALDTAPAGRTEALNPAELFLASVAACMLKGIERVVPMLRVSLRGAEVHVTGERQGRPPRTVRVTSELAVDSDESDARLALLHRNVREFGTIAETVAAAVTLSGTVRRTTLAASARGVTGRVGGA